MSEKERTLLKDKITDYKRYSFILISLTAFLFVGLIIPTGQINDTQQVFLVGGSVFAIGFATIFHRKAMKCEQQLYSEES